MATPKRPHLFVKILSGFGFIVLTLEWMLLLFAGLMRFIDTGLGKTILLPSESAPPDPVIVEVSVAKPDFVTTFLVTALALATILLVIYVVFVRYTRTVRTTGTKVVREATKKTLPIIARKPVQKLPAKRRRVLTRRVTYWVKLALAIIPVVLLPVILLDDHRGMAEQFAIFLQVTLGLVALSTFTLQTWLAWRWHVRQEELD